MKGETMKEITYYKCEKCGKVFEDKEDCINCENMHQDIANFEISNAEFIQGDLIPLYITIRHKGRGTEYQYLRG